MQHVVASLRRSSKFLQPSFTNDVSRSHLDWNVLFKVCSFDGKTYSPSRKRLDGRSYATTIIKTGQGHSGFCKSMQNDSQYHSEYKMVESLEVQQEHQDLDKYSSSIAKLLQNKAIGEKITSTDKYKFLLNMLSDLKDSKEAVYGALDAWVAWEKSFPLIPLKIVLINLQKEEQWHRIVQVIKWMLSKGQGNTMGTYEQLIRALEKDHRAEEAHTIWVKKIGQDLHSVPWRVCDLMISIYYRNNMLERLVKLFKGLESFDRKPPSKSIVQKVADAYEMLGILEEKNRVLEKYSGLFCKSTREHPKQSRRALKRFEKKADGREEKSSGTSEDGSGSCSENVRTEIVA